MAFMMKSPTVGKVMNRKEPPNKFLEEEKFVLDNDDDGVLGSGKLQTSSDVRNPIGSRSAWTKNSRPPARENSPLSSSLKSDQSLKPSLQNLISVLKGDSSPSESSPEIWGRRSKQTASPEQPFFRPKVTLQSRESMDSISNGIPNLKGKVGSLDQWQEDFPLPIYSEVSPEPIIRSGSQRRIVDINEGSDVSGEKNRALSAKDDKGVDPYIVEKLEPSVVTPIVEKAPAGLENVVSVNSSLNTAGSAGSTGFIPLEHSRVEESLSGNSRRTENDLFGQEEASLRALDDLHSENSNLRAEKRAKENESKELRRKLQEAVDREADCRKKVEKIEADYAKTNALLVALQNDTSDQMMALEETNAMLRDSENRISALQKEHEMSLARAREEFERKLASSEEVIQALQVEVRSLSEERNENFEVVREREEMIDLLKKDFENAKVEIIREKDQSYRENVAKLIATADTEIASLREKLAMAESQKPVNTLSDLGGDSRVSELVAEVKKLKNEKKLMQFKLQTAEGHGNEYESVCKKLEEAKQELARKDKEMVILKRMWDTNEIVRKAEVANARVLELEGKIKNEQKTAQELEEKLAQTMEVKGTLEFKNKKLEKLLGDEKLTSSQLSELLRLEQERSVELKNELENRAEKSKAQAEKSVVSQEVKNESSEPATKREEDELGALLRLAKGNGKIMYESDLPSTSDMKVEGIGLEFPGQQSFKRKDFFMKGKKKQIM